MLTGAAVGLDSSIMSTNGAVELLRASLMTTGAGLQLARAGEALPSNEAIAAPPSGSRPCETSFVCAAKLMRSSVAVPLAAVSTRLSPPPASLKFV